MARGIYSTRFCVGELSVAAGLTRTYIVPTGKVAIVRYVSFDVITGPATAGFNLTTLPGPTTARLARWSALAAEVISSWEGRAVIYPGEVLTIQNFSAAATRVVGFASGWLLTA